jgi:PAS domain-containing protein
MFFGFTSPSSAASALANLSFASRRTGRDRRAVVREMEERMAALDHAQALVELGTDGKVLDVNANFLALLETTAEAVLGQPYIALLTEAERAGTRFRQLHDRLLRGEAGSARLHHATRTKGPLDLRVDLVPVTGDDGKLMRLFGVVTNETEVEGGGSRPAGPRGDGTRIRPSDDGRSGPRHHPRQCRIQRPVDPPYN